MNYLIYAYYKKNTNEIVYVGLTNNLKRRRREHEVYEPQEKGRPHYDYPLSKGIRKYGVDYYGCQILEDNLTLQQAKDREKYWIAYYDTYNDPSKYNYTLGGDSFCTQKFENETIEKVKFLLEQKQPFQKIFETTGVSISHISEINTGKRWYEKNREYPINNQTYGRKLTPQQVSTIMELLENSDKRAPEISQEFGVSDTVIRRINRGQSYYNPNKDYPLRKEKTPPKKKKKLNEKELIELIDEIENSSTPFSVLAEKYSIGVTTVYNINNGTTRKLKEKNYPLRK